MVQPISSAESTQLPAGEMAASPLPLVSVIMPVRNESRYIRRAMLSVLRQDYPSQRLEVIVADGDSDDDTCAQVAALQRDNSNLTLIHNPARIVPVGLNAAMKRARGDVIVRVDGHCEVAPDYVRRCVAHLSHGWDGVGGPIKTIGETTVARAIAVGMSSRFGVGGSAFRTIQDHTLPADTIAFPAYRRDVMQRAGPFDEELVRNQDDEYNYRLRKSGAKLLLAPDVQSRYYSRSTLKGLWRQYFQYGYWKVRVMQKHWRQMRLRQFAPSLFVTVLMTSAVLAPWLSVARGSLALVTGSYVCCALLASCIAGWRPGPRVVVLLPVVYGTLHLAYGTGFLVGCLRFSLRWGWKSNRHGFQSRGAMTEPN